MKMRVGTRVLLSLFLLLVMAVCVLIILAAFGVVSSANVVALAEGFTETEYKYIWAGVALALIVVAIPLLFFGIKKDEPSSVTLASSTEGRVDITVEALKELAHCYLKDITEVIVQRVVVVPVSYRTLRMEIYLSVRTGAEIPAITTKISEEMRAYVEKFAGVLANQVTIFVLPQKQLQYPTK